MFDAQYQLSADDQPKHADLEERGHLSRTQQAPEAEHKHCTDPARDRVHEIVRRVQEAELAATHHVPAERTLAQIVHVCHNHRCHTRRRHQDNRAREVLRCGMRRK